MDTNYLQNQELMKVFLKIRSKYAEVVNQDVSIKTAIIFE